MRSVNTGLNALVDRFPPGRSYKSTHQSTTELIQWSRWNQTRRNYGIRRDETFPKLAPKIGAFKMHRISGLPRAQLGLWPTPIHKLDRLGEDICHPNLYIKRDDLSGLGLGGNKTRSLEFLLGCLLYTSRSIFPWSRAGSSSLWTKMQSTPILQHAAAVRAHRFDWSPPAVIMTSAPLSRASPKRNSRLRVLLPPRPNQMCIRDRRRAILIHLLFCVVLLRDSLNARWTETYSLNLSLIHI